MNKHEELEIKQIYDILESNAWKLDEIGGEDSDDNAKLDEVKEDINKILVKINNYFIRNKEVDEL